MTKAAEIVNPAWDIWCRLYGPDPRQFSMWARMDRDLKHLRDSIAAGRDLGDDGYEVRSVVIHHMTFAIPAPINLKAAAVYGPIVEMGAGTGYWAWCLRQMGIDVLAFDYLPPQKYPKIEGQVNRYSQSNGWFDCWWSDVKRGYPSSVRRHSDRTLLMVWPYMNDMAIKTLRAYEGDTLIYVGEVRAACATDEFFDELEAKWDKIRDIPIPQWPGMHDEMWIMKRRKATT